MGRLDGKVAVITGAASGIGLAATKRFVEEGAKVLGIDLDGAALEQALGGLGSAVSTFAADVTRIDQMEPAMQAAVDRFGGIDVVLANAGILGMCAPIEYASAGIRVNTVNPGPTDTPITCELESGINAEDPAQAGSFLKQGILLKRYAQPEEIAGLMLYLASDEATFCIGGVYMIDGGAQLV